ncbi:MAG: hypothetical protein J6T15_04195 [Bacilli bacterium]|nr:hypothetical protein [Bacilli bacterium]
MKNWSKLTLRKLKIASAVTATVVSFGSLISGTAAWFFTNQKVETDGIVVSAKNDGIVIESIRLCKFNYPIVDGESLYLKPEDGSVNVYDYVSGVGHERFEDANGNPQTMNLFDPVLVELGTDLRDLYCNAVFIVEVSAGNITAGLEVFADLLNKAKTSESDFYLSDCVDFDIYTPSDLTAVTGKTYYPSHIDDVENTTLTGYDELFYKISYLSEESATHANFYESNPKPSQIAIHDEQNLKTLNFVNGRATFYINVNYAPSELEKYARNLAVENRLGINDYVFSVDLV